MQDGKTQSIWTSGLVLQLCNVIWANTLFNTSIKDYNPMLVGLQTFILLQIPFTLFLVNWLPTEYLWHDVPEIIEDARIYLVIFLVVFLMMLPFVVYKRFMVVIRGQVLL